jgi:hypothetical protein
MREWICRFEHAPAGAKPGGSEDPPGCLRLARLSPAFEFHPWRDLSSGGANGVFPVSVTLGAYWGGNGKREFELIPSGVAADLSAFG